MKAARRAARPARGAGRAEVLPHPAALRALDRLSAVALESRRLEDLLQRTLPVMVEPGNGVDTGAILLREGDTLVVRAAVGLRKGLPGRFRLRIGEGFWGRIAAEGRPRLLIARTITAAAVGPLLEADRLRSLYGVPLRSNGHLLGVAHIGSSTASSLSAADRRLFEALCARATAAIGQHLLREALATQVSELQTVLQSIPDAVFVVEKDGVSHANRAALDLFGIDSVGQLNPSLRALGEVLEARHADTGLPLAPDERLVDRALLGETTAGEIVVRHQRTGQDVVLHCSLAPVLSGGQVVAAVAACTDVTARKRQEAERERLYREARQAVADRQHVLGVVSHDLRNPLNTIVLGAETLKDEGLPAEIRSGALAAITRAAHRMNRMISDLLDADSIEAGRLKLEPLPLDPASVVDEVLELFASQAARRGLRLQSDVSRRLPLVRGDRHRLVQALANLVSNALKVTSEGAVRVAVAPGESEVVFSVVDEGPGIPEDVRGRLFEPYWRAESAPYRGTGLGLSIVRGIVEGHGGRVWIESAPGGGAAFRFTVPLA